MAILRAALDIARKDSDWSGGPAEYDYLSAELIAGSIGLLDAWRTLEYQTPSPTAVLRHLWRLYDEELVWTWGDGTPTTRTRRWALAT